MLKWTLRAPPDACSCPPSPPLKSSVRSQPDFKVDLEDSNKCWFEARVKVAEVKSTSRVVQFNSKENVKYQYTENDKELERDNNNIFPSTVDEIEKRKSVHKYVKCKALDPMNIFTGDMTDSDTGSVYMKLDKTPAALLQKELPLTSSGPFDPRRRPLIDISNGDYSDLRKHLQMHNVSLSTLLHQVDLPPPPAPYQDRGPNNCSQQFSPGNVLTFYEQLRNFQRGSEKFPQLDKVPTRVASGYQGKDSASSSRQRSSVARTRNFETTEHFANNSCTLTTTSVTTTTSCSSATSVSCSYKPSSKLSCTTTQKNVNFKEKKEPKMTKTNKFSVSRNRHSIADIRCVSKPNDHNHFESERAARTRNSHRVKDSSHSFFSKTDEKKKELNENQKRSSAKRLGIYHKIFDAKVCGRKKVKQEPIYESIQAPKGTDPVATSTAELQNTPNREIYMSMKDLRTAENNNAHEIGAKEDDYEICVFSSPPEEFQDKKRAPIQLTDFHVYENALYLSIEEKNVKPSLPNSFIPDDLEKGDTCDFTSEPKRNVHKPVAIKGSNDLIARFGKSASDRQHPMPQFGLHISSDPVKKPCKWRDIHESDNSWCKSNDSCLNGRNKYCDSIGNIRQISIPQSNFYSQRHYENLDFLENQLNQKAFPKIKSEPCIFNPSHLHASTGQHLHATSMSAINLSGLPLHNLRPHPPPSCHANSITNGPQNHFSNKIKKKSKPFLRLDANLPVIYEVHSQEEEINSSGLKIDREEIHKNIYRDFEQKNDELNISGSSPDSESNKSNTSDNLDSGLSEGINTPLISPMSAPPSPNSDSLLGEPQTALSLEDLKIYKENEAYSQQKFFPGTYINDILTSEYLNQFCEHDNGIKEAGYDRFNITDIHVNHSTPIKSDELLNKEPICIENGCTVDLSKLVRSTIEKNLFAPSTPGTSPISNLSFKSSHSCSINRRHSFASIKDISKTGSNKMDSYDQSSTAGTIFHNPSYSSNSTPCVLRKSHSFMSLSPATKTIFVPKNKGVMEDSGNTSDKDSFLTRETELEGGCVLTPGGKDVSGKAEMEVPPIKGPGRTASGQGCFGREGISPSPADKTRKGRGDGLVWQAGENQNVYSGGFTDKWTSNSSPDHRKAGANASLPSDRIYNSNSCISHHHHSFHPPFLTSSSLSSSSFDLPSFLPSGNLTLPGEMKKEAQMSRTRHITGHSVPPLQPLSKDALLGLEKLPQLITSQELTQRNDPSLTERQRLRHAESLFRLQRLLDEPPSHRDYEDGDAESSADWSLEAVIDEASLNGFDSPFCSPESSKSGSEPDSQDCQDSFSICTLDSDLADSVYIGPKLCDKIREVSEEKMLSKLRRSFRKKDKRLPKVGLFMLVDNPMYVSPEAKKEAKIISFTPSKRKSFRFKIKGDKDVNKESDKKNDVYERKTLNRNSFWYVGNPTYNSPGDFTNSKNKSFHTIECEKENLKNYQVTKSISTSSPRPRLPLRDMWIQTNPCYESPSLKTTTSPSKRKKDSPRREKIKKPLPDLPIQPPPVRTIESHYLTPILSKKPPLPLRHDSSILDIQKYIDHEYCTIAGDEESDSRTSHSSSSRKSESSPSAKRNLNFQRGQERISLNQPLEGTKQDSVKDSFKGRVVKGAGSSRVKASNTPSRIWRIDSDINQEFAPKKGYKDTLEKSLENQMPFGDRGYKTPRSVKREKMNKNFSKSRVPPDLPGMPAPLPPNFSGRHLFDDTNAFHHATLDEGIGSSAETSSVFQLAPDSIYESISFRHLDRSPGLTSPSHIPHPLKSSVEGTTSGICSSCSSNKSSACSCNYFSSPPKSRNRTCRLSKGKEENVTLDQGSSINSVMASSSSGISSSYSKSPPDSVFRKKKARGCRLNVSRRSAGRPSSSFNVSSHSLGGGRGRKTPRKMISKKYKAREVLQGQLRISVYENCGLLTIHIIEARKLRPNFSTVCNPYVKISLVPDDLERTFCRTTLLRATNTPFFDQKFSFDFLPEDFNKRLLISLWNRDTLRKRSEFLGCMSFSVIHILSKRVSGWFRLLTEAVGRRKHFAVSFLTGSVDNSRCNEQDALPPVSLPANHLGTKCPPISRMTSSAGNSPPLGQTPYTISVNIQRTNDGFGFSVAWTRPPRIERVEPGKAADVSGLKTGDYIIFVGNQNVVKLDENSVLKIIRDCGEQLDLEVYRRGVSKTPKTMLNGWARPPPLSTTDPTSSITTSDTFRKNKIGHGIPGNEVGGVLI